MNCDLCRDRDLNSLIQLQKEYFLPNATKKMRKSKKVCEACLRKMAKNNQYRLRRYWNAILMRGEWTRND